MKLVFSLLMLFAFWGQPSDRFNRYRPVESYGTEGGILLLPVYSAKGSLCEINIEKRHSFNNRFDLNPTLTKDQIISLFDELVPRSERGSPGWKLPEGSEFGEVDGGIRATHIMYENLSLVMYGAAHAETYASAVISWKKAECGVP